MTSFSFQETKPKELPAVHHSPRKEKVQSNGDGGGGGQPQEPNGV